MFYHKYWDIIKVDMCNAATQFFNTGWLLPNFNANTSIMIPSLEMSRHITLSNFKYKIISEILADKLASIMPHPISKEQRWFIHGRNIQDCTCLASDAINVLDNMNVNGNLDLKLDIVNVRT